MSLNRLKIFEAIKARPSDSNVMRLQYKGKQLLAQQLGS
jgi:hypothetical protein